MKTSTKITIYTLLLAASLVWLAVLASPNYGELKLVFCNVGQGDGMLITKANIQIIIDGGPNNKISDCIAKHIPFWDRQIELVILTHPHADHLTGLIKIFEDYKVLNYLANDINADGTQSYSLLLQKVKEENAQILRPVIGSSFDFSNTKIQILAPVPSLIDANDLNSYSIVAKLSYGKITALLTGDIQEKESEFLSGSMLIKDVNILKVPHHGSDHGATESLINKIKPEVSVISVGKNSYGHPNQNIITLLESLGSKVKRTDRDGDIIITTNGLWYTMN